MSATFETQEFKQLQNYISARCTDEQVLKNLEEFALAVVSIAIRNTPDFNEVDMDKINCEFKLYTGEFKHIWKRSGSQFGFQLLVRVMTSEEQVFISKSYMPFGNGQKVINFYLEGEVDNWVQTA